MCQFHGCTPIVDGFLGSRLWLDIRYAINYVENVSLRPEVHESETFVVSLPNQMGLQRWWEQEIPVDGTINKGELMTHNLTELIKPESYEVRLTPITRFGEGDSTIRIVTYSGECSTMQRSVTFGKHRDTQLSVRQHICLHRRKH